ncbi:MAG: 5-nucleotidase [Burkholderiales bacterium]
MKHINATRLVALSVAAAAITAGYKISNSSPSTNQAAKNVDIKIIAFNDFHGNLEPPKLSIFAPARDGGAKVAVPAGGVAYMASAIKHLKGLNPNHAVVSAGDMIGASPLVSALFLDEPTIEVFNEIRIDFNAVGNHEFDKGKDELLRMKNGGCAKHTLREPCQVNKAFPGANFGFLAANTVKADGSTLFPATGIKEFGSGAARVKVGFIGMTLQGTPGIVTPAGVQGLTFKDEAKTANALIPQLKAQGADIIVVVVHEGGMTTGGYNDKSCPDLTGDIIPILKKLDPAVDVVVSGHTHRAYICDYGKTDPAKPFLLTSAGQYGTLVTDINLTIDLNTRKLVSKSANNLIVQGEPFTGSSGTTVALSSLYPSFPKDQGVDQIISQYATAAAPLAQRAVGNLTASITRRQIASGESALGNLIADAQLAATSAAERGGAQIALMNPGGVRSDLNVPAGGGTVTYGQIFGVQPFSNSLVVKNLTGAKLRALLEQQFHSGANTTSTPRILFPSAGFSYGYDLSQPAGSRITDMRLNGIPIADSSVYRVTMNSFLATGGDSFTVFKQGSDDLGGVLDVDALEAYLRNNSPVAPPSTNRIKRID